MPLRIGGEAHISIGGSRGTKRQTATSDTDLFVVSDFQRASKEELRAYLGLLLPAPIDLEYMTLARFYEVTSALLHYKPAASAGLSPFRFDELRFLVRVYRGEQLLRLDAVQARLDECADLLRQACAFYISSMYVMKYQDAYGLVMLDRSDEVLLIAGELVQYACLLGLLQTALPDLAPKWAPSAAREDGSPMLQIASKALIRHLARFSHGSPSEWCRGLLRLCNAAVAAGVSASRNCCSAVYSPQQDPDLVFCLLGVPGYLLATSVIDRDYHVVNDALIATYLDVSRMSAA